MVPTVLQELTDPHAQALPLTVEQYHQMIATGILPEGEPYELLDGFVVRKDRSKTGEDPMTVGLEHISAVQRLGRLGRKLEQHGCHMRTQQPISIPPHQEPEPDGAIVIGREEDYDKRLPGPKDVLCVIEVADASLRRDRGSKLRIFASGGIPLYMIINLPDRVVEVYSQPLAHKGRYGQSATLDRGERLDLPTASRKALVVPVRQLLP